MRSLHQQRAQIQIAFLADVHLRFALSRVAPSWLQSQIAAHIAALAKTVRVFQRQQVGERNQRARTALRSSWPVRAPCSPAPSAPAPAPRAPGSPLLAVIIPEEICNSLRRRILWPLYRNVTILPNQGDELS